MYRNRSNRPGRARTFDSEWNSESHTKEQRLRRACSEKRCSAAPAVDDTLNLPQPLWHLASTQSEMLRNRGLGTLTVKTSGFGSFQAPKNWPGEPSLGALSGPAWPWRPCLAPLAAASLHKPKTIEKPLVFGAFSVKMLKNLWFLKLTC